MTDPVKIANEALECQLRYYDWAKTPGRLYECYLTFLVESGMSTHAVAGGDPTELIRRMGYTPEAVDYYAESELEMINSARTVAVSADMLDIAKYNGGVWWEPHTEEFEVTVGPDRGGWRKNIQPGDPDWSTLGFEADQEGAHLPVLTREMLPFTEPGFLWFEKPVPFPDFDLPIVNEHGPGHLPSLHVRAIAWQEVPQVAIGEDEDGEITVGPGLALTIYIDHRYLPGSLIMIDFTGWGYNAEYRIGYDWMSQVSGNTSTDAHTVNPHVAMLRILLSSLFGIMRSSIELTKPSRNTRRRAERSNATFPEYGEVQVITLRTFLGKLSHKSGPTDPAKEVHWRHRWLVRGHWAWRHCNPENADEGEDCRKRVYIEAFVKGPEDRPLIIRDKIYAVVR